MPIADDLFLWGFGPGKQIALDSAKVDASVTVPVLAEKGELSVMVTSVPQVIPPAGQVQVIWPSPVRKLPLESQPLSVKVICSPAGIAVVATNEN